MKGNIGMAVGGTVSGLSKPSTDRYRAHALPTCCTVESGHVGLPEQRGSVGNTFGFKPSASHAH